MADISKINPDGAEYNLKDATARTNIGNLASLHTTAKNDAVSAINEVKDEQANKADNDEVAPEFNDETAYSTGELVYKDGQLYKFDSDHAAGAWDASEVSLTTVAAEFNQLKNTLTKCLYGLTVTTDSNAGVFYLSKTTIPHVISVVITSPQYSRAIITSANESLWCVFVEDGDKVARKNTNITYDVYYR